MMDELGVFQHNMANSSPVSYENLIYVSTSNGQDESHVNVPSPKSPAIIALDKTTGKLVWEDASPGDKILHGQWSSPAVGKIGDTVQVVIGQGDGWVRGYEAKSGKKLWEFDLNPKDSVWPKTRNEVISTPIIYENVVYIANGQDPEHGEGVGHLYAIDPTKTGDITKSGQIWHYDKIRRSISTGAIYNGILFYSDFSGFLHALDVKTGKPFWTHDMFAAIWGSPIVIGGKVYLGDEDGDVTVLNADRTMKVVAESNMGSSVYSTPVPANGALFIVNRNQLFAISEDAGSRDGRQVIAAGERGRRVPRALSLRCSSRCHRSRRAELAAVPWPDRPRGVADRRRRRSTWDLAPDRRNVAWKTAIPGLAHSSPIVWGDRIYLTTAVAAVRQADASSPAMSSKSGHRLRRPTPVRHTWRLIAIDKASGKIVWDQVVHEGVPRMKRHVKASHASATPATDGRIIVALLGSEGLFCFDMNGNAEMAAGPRRHGRRARRRSRRYAVGAGQLAGDLRATW